MRRVPKVPGEIEDRAIKALKDGLDGVIRSPISNGVLVEGIKGGAQGVLEVPHGLGRKALGCLVLGADRGMYLASVRSSDARVAKVAMAPQWEWITRYEDDAGVSAFNFDFTANGDEDYEYVVEGYWKNPANQLTTAYWRVNDSSSGLTNAYSIFSLDSAAATSAAGLIVARNIGNTFAADETQFKANLIAASGVNRMGVSQFTTTRATGSSQQMGSSHCKWEQDSVSILKLGLAFTAACEPGSYFDLYRRPRLKGRTLTLWMF